MTPMRAMREPVSEAEWDLRVNLAACYRLVAKYGMTDLNPQPHHGARAGGR
jgi:hypothetical protein